MSDNRAHERGRPKRYWTGEWPNLDSIAVSIPSEQAGLLSNAALGVYTRLLWAYATQIVHSYYSEPKADPFLSEKHIPHLAYCTKGEWRKVRDELEPLFSLKGDEWRLRDLSVLRFMPPIRKRDSLPANVRAQILERDGESCRYCGTEQGPFDIDHIIPVVSGGGDHPENLCVACAPCNRSKGAKSLEDWKMTL